MYICYLLVCRLKNNCWGIIKGKETKIKYKGALIFSLHILVDYAVCHLGHIIPLRDLWSAMYDNFSFFFLQSTTLKSWI